MRSGGTRVHDGSHALGDAIRIGRNAEWGDSIVNVNVNIDHAGRDNPAPRVEHLASFGLGNIGSHERNGMANDRHIALGGESLRRVDHTAATDKKIVAGGRAVRL